MRSKELLASPFSELGNNLYRLVESPGIWGRKYQCYSDGCNC